jgi:hypothetical protein
MIDSWTSVSSVLLAATAAVPLMLVDGAIGRAEGTLLVAAYAAFLGALAAG